MRWSEGTPLDDYQIVEELYHGAHGVAYTARHTQSEENAVLVVLRDLDLEAAEGPIDLQKLGLLNHPGIASIQGGWILDDLVFLVGQLPRGRSLDAIARLPEGEQGLDQIARNKILAWYVKKVADALHEVHELGLVHGDLRIQDVVIKEDGTPSLLGMGWASLIGRPGSLETTSSIQDLQAASRILYRLFTGREFVDDEDAGDGDPGNRLAGLPMPIQRIIEKSLPGISMSGISMSGKQSGPAYSVEHLSSDLRRYIAEPVTPTQPAPKKRRRSQSRWLKVRSFMKSKLGYWGPLIAIGTVGLVASLAMSVFFPHKFPFLSLKREVVVPAGGTTMSLGSMEPGWLAERVDQGRANLQSGCLEEALKELLFVQKLAPEQVATDLLVLAERYYERGRTRTSDQLLNKMVDWYQGTETSWRAFLQRKRLYLDIEYLHELSSSLEELLEGPLKLQNPAGTAAFRGLMNRIQSITLTSYPRPGDSLFGSTLNLGRFLPGDRDAWAVVSGLELSVTRGDTVVKHSLEQKPVYLDSLAGLNHGRDRMLLAYESGRVELWDAAALGDEAKGSIEWSLDLPVSILGGWISCPAREGASLAVAFQCGSDDHWKIGVLDLLDADKPILFSLRADRVFGLFDLDCRTESEGREWLVVMENQGETRILVMGLDRKRRSLKKLYTQTLPGTVGAFLKPGQNLQDPCLPLLGLNPPVTPNRVEDALPGIYRLVRAPPVEEGETEILFSLELLKTLEKDPQASVPRILGGTTGDYNGDGLADVAFLVRFPGWAEFAPESRILLHQANEGFTWFHCQDARSISSGDLDGREGQEIVVERKNTLLGVSLSK